MDVAVVSPTEAVHGSPPYRPAAIQTVTPDYHAALGIPVKLGRFFEATDSMSGPPVAVVSETMARMFWHDLNVLGKTMLRTGDSRPLTIVGVIGDVRQAGLDRAPVPMFYVPMAQAHQAVRTLTFVASTQGEPAQIVTQVKRIVSETDNTLPIFALQTGEDLVSSLIATRRFNMVVVAVFAGIALCLAVMGLYAVMTYIVAQSSREFGIRMAVGATVFSIVRLIVGRALRLLVAGILIGWALSAGVSQFVSSVLFGVQPNDPGTFVLVALLLSVVSGLAVIVPAVRAARVDPIACLRNE
jgi:ABC-type antimicrobial peptide transport system permease subunit